MSATLLEGTRLAWPAGALAAGALLLATALAGAPAQAESPAYLEATRSAGGTVMVDLTVKIAANTHSANDLDRYDLAEITVLEAGARQHHPIAAPQLGGHHSRGKLVFAVPGLEPPFTIRIEGLDDTGIRRFAW